MMERFKFGKKSISLILTVLMVITSVPLTQVFAATKKSVECPDCHGSKVVDCATCTDGYTDVDCSNCTGTGTVACPDCTDGTDGEGNTCDTCNGTLLVTCTECNGMKKELCSDCAGIGTIECSTCDGTGKIEKEYEICPDCNGTKKCSHCEDGHIYLTCGTCSGSGSITVNCAVCSGLGTVKVNCATCSGSKAKDCTACETGKIECLTCLGTGKLADDTDCLDCEATGYVNCTACGGTQKVVCTDCDTEGKIDVSCTNCSGSGKVTQDCSNCADGKIETDCSVCDGSNKCKNCKGTGELETLNDTSFKFAVDAPTAIKVSDKFVNAATSEKNSTGLVTYSVDDTSKATIDDSGTLTALKVGKVTVTASIATDYTYSSKEITYDITIDPATPIIDSISVSDLTYGEKLSDSEITAVAKVSGVNIPGTFKWDDAQKDIVPTVVADSETTLYNYIFTPNDNLNYTTVNGQTTVKVNKADITGITVTDLSPVYNGNPQSVLNVEGTESGDEVTYSLDNVTYNDSFELTNVLDSTTLYVKVHRDGNYNDAVITTTATILPASIDGVDFSVYSGTYDGQEHPVFDSVSGAGYRDGDTIKYYYNGNESDSLSFKNAGTYEFTVKISREDSNYKETDYPTETEAKFVVNIAKKDITVTANDVKKIYAGTEFSGNGAKTVGLVEGHSLSDINITGTGISVGDYVLTPSNAKFKDSTENDVTANYNITYIDGKLTILKADLVVTPDKLEVLYNAKSQSPASKAYTIDGLVLENHKEEVKLVGAATAVGTHKDAISVASIEIKEGEIDVTSNYNITCNKNDIVISYLELSNYEDAYEYSVPDGDNGWYHNNVTISAKEGYEISYQNENTDDFTENLVYSIEGHEGKTKPAFAIKRLSDGAITSVDNRKQISIDTVSPIQESIKIGFYKTALTRIINVLTFGVFFNNEVELRIEANDETSGMWKADVTITDMEGNEVTVFNNNTSTFGTDGASFILSEENLNKLKNFVGILEFVVYDISGNKTEFTRYINDGKITLTEDSLNPSEAENNIDNYLVYENADAHKQYSSITIKPEQTKVSNQTKQTEVDLNDYISESYLEDDAMSFKKFAPLYNEAVKYNVSFADKYSGILNAQVIVFNNNTKKEYLNTNYNFISNKFDDKGVWTKKNSASNDKIVESANVSFEINKNANDIVILAIITDNAGNISYDYYNFGIDTKKPVVDYKFTTNGSDTKSGAYYNKKTVYTLEVCDRNFPVGNEKVGKITYTLDGKEKSVTLTGKDFVSTNNEKCYSDNQKYTYTLNALSNEGQYENFKFEAADRAKNNKTVSSKMTFFYDHTRPVVTVKDDNTGVKNGKFYQDKRVVTITVKDRYIDKDSFKYNVKSATNFDFKDNQAGEKYHTNNRTLTYVFTFETGTSIDCYLNGFSVTDKAGNVATEIGTLANADDFVVDGKTPNTFTAIITTPKNKNGVNVSGNDYKVFVEDDITLTITCKDENLSKANLSKDRLICRSLTSSGKTKNTDFSLIKKSNGSRNEVIYSAKNLDQDGFYELSYTITDDSGKESAKQTITFAICRNGAMFNKNELDKITNSEEMFNAENVNEISFRQYSASKNTNSIIEISSDSVQFPRRILVKDVDYIMTGAVQDSDTLVYTSVYKLLRKAFELENGAVLDGVYTVKVTPLTKDANNVESKNAPSQTFTVTLDATDPVMNAKLDYTTSYNKVFENVVIENNEKYKFFANSATLTFELSDSYSGIDEKSIEVKWQGEELKYETNENGEYKVVLNANNKSNGNEIVIGALDKAGNQVSTSFTVKMDNNFWIYTALGGFACVGALALGIVLIIRKKKLGADSAE